MRTWEARSFFISRTDIMKVDSVDALVLCGGKGSRLQSSVADRPKVMAEVNGRPFLDYILDHLENQGLRRVILCTGYKAEMIQDHYRDQERDLFIDFARESEPLGTGGALKHAAEIIDSEDFFVLNGDSFCPLNFERMLSCHTEKGGIATIAVSPVDGSKDYGRVLFDEHTQIHAFEEKIRGESGWVNAGVYCLNEDILSAMPQMKTFSLEYDCFPKWIPEGLIAFEAGEPFWDIGTPERLERAKQEL